MEKHEMIGAIEAILYVAGEPVEEESLRMALETTAQGIEEALEALHSQYEFERRGIRLLRFGRSVQLSTRPEYADFVERLLQPIQRQNLSQAAMETLAVIAYRQPATRGDVEAVRGVKCDYSVASLLGKGLIAESGRRDTLGRPMLFVTTDLFLRHFGIASLDELPQIDFAAAARQAGEDAVMPETGTHATVTEAPTANGASEASETGQAAGVPAEAVAAARAAEDADAQSETIEEAAREADTAKEASEGEGTNDRDPQADAGDG